VAAMRKNRIHKKSRLYAEFEPDSLAAKRKNFRGKIPPKVFDNIYIEA